MRRCEAAETDPSLRPALRASWPKVEPYRVADDDPRVKLRGQRGLRAAQAIKKHSVIGPYQARNCVICAHAHCAVMGDGHRYRLIPDQHFRFRMAVMAVHAQRLVTW